MYMCEKAFYAMHANSHVFDMPMRTNTPTPKFAAASSVGFKLAQGPGLGPQPKCMYTHGATLI